MSDENELRDEYERGFTDGYCCDAEQWDPAKAKALESCGWVRVVRCRDCEYFETLDFSAVGLGETYVCKLPLESRGVTESTWPDDYCSHGERREP